MKPIRMREESNPLENVSNSLSESLLFRTKKRSLLSVLLSFASFESAREELQLSDAFIVVSIRRSISSTTTEEHHHHHQLGERKRVTNFCLGFCFFFLGQFSCSLALSLHIFFVRENTHHKNTRPKIMVRSLYTYMREYTAFVRSILRFIFSSEREKLVRAGESRSRLSLLRRSAMMMMLFTREFLVNRVF